MAPRLGEVLIDLGFLTPEQLVVGLERQKQDGRRLGEVLISMGLISEEKLSKALRRQTGTEEWDPRRMPVHERVIASFPAELALRHRVFPVAMRRNSVGITWCIATTDPTDGATLNLLGSSLCTPDEPVVIVYYMGTRADIDAAIDAHYARAQIRASEDPEIVIEDPIEEPIEDPSTPERTALARIRITKKS